MNHDLYINNTPQPPPIPSLAEKDWKSWLQALHGSVWGHFNATNGHDHYIGAEECRRLSTDEWGLFKHVITQHSDSLILEMFNANVGFGCGIRAFAEPLPIFPGVDEAPTFLCALTKDHLPIPVRPLRSDRLADRTFFKDGWEMFSPLSHTPANTAKARLYKRFNIDEPRSIGHYDY